MAEKLSVTIVTLNEEKNIERCLQSVQWADEIIIVDSGSSDQTLEICRRYPCKTISSEWLGFGRTKRLAVDRASHDWILSIDADEEVTPELRNQILNLLKTTPPYQGYRIKRKSYYLGKPISYCGWNRDYPLRLFNRTAGNFNDKLVHEAVKISGNVGRLEALLFHFTYPTVHSHIEKMNRYAELGATQLFEKGRSASICGAVFRGVAKFLKMFILRRGFLDGKIGFILCYNSAFGVYLKYLKLWEMRQ